MCIGFFFISDLFKMKILCLLLLAIIAKGFCNCLSNNSTSNSDDCFMGNCINNVCVCFDGWKGDQCDTCFGRTLLTDSSGVITEGPENYSHLSKCSWLIEPALGNSVLRLQFNEFVTECGWDHLYVYDGDSVFSPLIGAFNGIIQTKSDSKLPLEIIASSGKAFLHFYSDQAFSMAGFNISYAVDDCLYDCFNRGTCNDGTCDCNMNFSGEKCDLCNCNGTAFQCLNDTNVCSQSTKPDWSVVEFNSSVLTSRGSFSVSTFNNSTPLLLYGGFNFDLRFSDDLYSFDANEGSWTSLSSQSSTNSSIPALRYEHASVTRDSSLLVFGGKLIENETTVDDLWEYDVVTSSWSLVDYITDFDQASVSNLRLAGHSADLVTFSNGSEIMVVMFGYHPIMGYSPFVYEYEPTTKSWIMPKTNGTVVQGLFGHTTVYDSVKQRIYIHGGVRLTGTGRINAYSTDQMLAYDPESRRFSQLTSSGHSRFLHSSSFIDGVVYVYGGTVQNASSSSSGTACYLSGFMAYYVDCDRWSALPSPTGVVQGNRYGHQSSIVRSSNQNQVHIISGFDSTMISNILIYTIPTCSELTDESSCASSYNRGVLCQWTGSACSSMNASASACPQLPEPDCSSFGILAPSKCESHSSCEYCSDSFSCVKLGNCSTNNSNMPDRDELYCASLNKCELCENSPGGMCEWENSCGIRGNGTSADVSKCSSTDDCQSATSCDGCTNKASCLWCQNVEKCVATSSYVIQFPYGQCKEWTKDQPCPSYSCSAFDTCSSCQNDSRCGWCDDGSLTGTGSCKEGGGSGPVYFNSTQQSYVVSSQLCGESSWFFTGCPLCQCNGHSTCFDNVTCSNCTDNTIGDHCEECADGFFGNALNGGNCSLCQCGGKAESCDSFTGSCFCSTKGEIGPSCEQCDVSKGYVGNATGSNGTCYYDLTENFIFTFNLVETYVTAINFRNQPQSVEDVLLSFSSSIVCDVRLAIVFNSSANFRNDLTVQTYESVSSFDFTFRTSEYSFGPERGNTTIRIYVTKLVTPVQIKISLIQYNNAILKLLLALFSALLAILIIAAVVWKLKIMYDDRQRRANRAIQMKEMAARPFAGISLLCDDIYRSTQSVLSRSSTPYQLLEANQTPDVICEEKCEQGNASVASVFLWLPSNVPCEKASGENESTSSRASDLNCFLSPPPGQASLAIGTVLVSNKNNKKRGLSPRSTSSPNHVVRSADRDPAAGDASVVV